MNFSAPNSLMLDMHEVKYGRIGRKHENFYFSHMKVKSKIISPFIFRSQSQRPLRYNYLTLEIKFKVSKAIKSL